jgi:hypothetical protein
MLKDNIHSFYIIKLNERTGEPFHKLRGTLEVIGMKDGKVIHYDKGDNTVTVWGKHSVMHLLSGEVFSDKGRTRGNLNTDHFYSTTGDTGLNSDGTQHSGEQHFCGARSGVLPNFPGTLGWWSQTATAIPTLTYPFFPTKMLFGTGKEWNTWTAIGDSAYWSYYIAQDAQWTAKYDPWVINDIGWPAGSGTAIANEYSDAFVAGGDTVPKKRTMNDIYSGILVSPLIQDADFGIAGAIKDGGYRSYKGDSVKLQMISGNYFLKTDFAGIGKPCWVYAKREARYYQAGAEVSLDFDASVENKITYSVTLPEQTGPNAGRFYPYNGYILKVAGLFCDARMMLRGDQPADDAHSDDTALQEFKNWQKMPGGLLIAKRYIAPITKTHDISITCRWTLFL